MLNKRLYYNEYIPSSAEVVKDYEENFKEFILDIVKKAIANTSPEEQTNYFAIDFPIITVAKKIGYPLNKDGLLQDYAEEIIKKTKPIINEYLNQEGKNSYFFSKPKLNSLKEMIVGELKLIIEYFD